MTDLGIDLASLTARDRAVLEEYLGTKEAILRLADSGVISDYAPYPHQLRLHEAPESTRFLLGANKMGKSWFLRQEGRWFGLREHPFREVGEPQLIWACCPTEELSMMYQQPEFIQAIGWDNIAEYRRGAHPMLVLRNGCTVLFKYYAQGPKAFPTASVDLICFDEEPQWPIWQECWARRGTRPLNIVGAITTVGGMTPLITAITTPGQLPSCHYETASIWDNPAISDEEKERFAAGYKHDPVMYAIRVEGKIMPVGGTGRFDPNALMEIQRTDVRDPKVRLDFDFANKQWVQKDDGPLWIWELPEPGHEYVIGGDIAEGINIGQSDIDPIWDNTSLAILGRTYRSFCAEYTVGNVEPAAIGEEILPRLSDMFNGAWANIEINNHGYTVVSAARHKMPNRLWSPVKDRADTQQKPLRKLGTLMSDKSRRFAIDTLAQEIHERSIEVPSGHAVQEMMQFVRKANNRVEHQEGSKDDRVFAYAHAVVCDRGLPQPRVKRAASVAEQMRLMGMARRNAWNVSTANDLGLSRGGHPPPQQKRIQWFRKIV